MRTSHIILSCLFLILLCATIASASAEERSSKKMGETELSGTDSSGYAPDELIVQFSSSQTDEKIAKKVEKFYGKETKKNHKIILDYSSLGLPYTYLLKLSPGENPKEVKEKYKQDPEVIYAEPNYLVTVVVIPNDPSFSLLWGLHNTGQRGYADSDIDAPESWNLCTGSTDVVVAVIDTGVDYNHPDLSPNIWMNQNEIQGNGIDDDRNGYIDDYRGWDFYNRDNNPIDDNGHGTHCAGTIGASGNNGRGVAGVQWATRIMPLKFMNSAGSGYTSDAAAAILYANMMGADVISNSWGGTGQSSLVKNAIDASSAVVVCAAGNSGTNNDATPFYPASYSSPQLIAVAATNAYDNLASFSNYGSTSVDVAAPGDYIYSTIRGTSYGYMSGTSMATPHVAGLAGLVKAYNPALTSSQIKEAILTGVDKKSSLNGKILTSGRINAYRTLSAVQPVAVLSVTSIEPSSGYNTGLVIVTVTGTGFGTGTTARLARPDGNGITGTGVTIVSQTKLTVSFDLAGLEAGGYNLILTTSTGQSVAYQGFTVLSSLPTLSITSINPSSVQAGAQGFVLTVTGSNFTSNSMVAWNGNGRTTTFVSGNQLQAAIPASDVATAGTVTITVTDPDRLTSNGMVFTITSSLAAPGVSSVDPRYLPRSTTRSLSIYGSNFVTGAQAELRRTGYSSILCNSEIVQNSGKITCTITIPSTTRTGYWDLAIINPDAKTGIKSYAVMIY